jgi:type I restriction enzyme R subunit
MLYCFNESSKRQTSSRFKSSSCPQGSRLHKRLHAHFSPAFPVWVGTDATMPINEADTCRTYVLPKFYAAGWEDTQISEQKSFFTDGWIVVVGNRAIRRQQKRADYLLRYRRDFPIAVVEAKAAYRTAGDGLQQAKQYAQILGLKFAYATNGHTIIEHDFLTGLDNELQEFPTPSALWGRLKTAQNISEKVGNRLLTPDYHLSGKSPRAESRMRVALDIRSRRGTFRFISTFNRVSKTAPQQARPSPSHRAKRTTM